MKKKKNVFGTVGNICSIRLKGYEERKRKEKKKKRGKDREMFRVVGEVTRHVKIENGKFDNFSDRKRVSEIYRNARNEVLLNAVISTPATIFRR